MVPRANKTAYFLNQTLGYLALIARRVRFPDMDGSWIFVADAIRAPWEATALLSAAYPRLRDAERLPFVALLTDFDVEEFESEIASSGSARKAAQTMVPD